MVVPDTVALHASSRMPPRPEPVDLAIHDAKIVALREIDERAVLRQRPAAAVEHEARERDVIGAARRDQRGAAGEDQPRRAAHADQLRAARQRQPADAIIAGTEHQRHARARGLVDRACSMLLWSAPPPARTPSCVASTPKVESGAAPAGVAKRCDRARRQSARRRQEDGGDRFSWSGSDENSEQTVQVSGQEIACRDGTDRGRAGATG